MELRVNRRLPRTVRTGRSVSLSISDIDTDDEATQIVEVLKKQVPILVNKVTGQELLIPGKAEKPQAKDDGKNRKLRLKDAK